MPSYKIKNRAEKGKNISPPINREELPELEPPIFSFRYMSQRDFSLAECNQEAKAALADKLHRLSQLTWQQLKLADRHGLGYEKISQTAIKAPIPTHITQDGNFIAFRFYNKAPMVGYRDGAIFYLIWLDPNFKLYDHG